MFPAHGSKTVWKIEFFLKTPSPLQHVLCCPLGEFSMKDGANCIANFLNDNPEMLLTDTIGGPNVTLFVTGSKKSIKKKVLKRINIYVCHPLSPKQ